jgi:hypothetical protein
MIIRGLSHGLVKLTSCSGALSPGVVAMPGVFHYPLPRVFLKREEK